MKLSIVLLGLLLSVASNAKSSSVYTKIDSASCKTIESSANEQDPEIDYYTGHCKGKDGYSIVISGGDSRYSLSLLFKDTLIDFTRIGNFHDMGADVIEWRGRTDAQGKISKLDSLIYRLNIDQYNEDAQENISQDTLFVVRLKGAKSCVVGMVHQSASMNEKARKIADDLSLPCKRLID